MAQAAALSGAEAHGAQVGNDGRVVEAGAVAGWAQAPLRLHHAPHAPGADTLGPETEVSGGVRRARAFDAQAESGCGLVGFVGFVWVVIVWVVLGFVEVAERQQARSLSQFFRRPSAPELAEISRR